VPGAPGRVMVDNVPFFAQEKFQCGPAALAMVLGWGGMDISPAELSSQVYSPGVEGSLQGSIIGSARRHGRVAYPIAGSKALLAEVAGGHPVIVLVNLGLSWYPKWHYAVVVGYDQPDNEIILHSGLTASEHLNYRVFLNIWRRSDFWGLLVLPPNQLPAGVDETEWLTAVAALERSNNLEAAAIGYAAVLEKWPQSFAGWMALGNNKYRLKELNDAEQAFLRATELEPDNGMAFNNLAQVLSEQGRKQAALAAAQRAVSLGGPLLDIYKQTLQEIKLSFR